MQVELAYRGSKEEAQDLLRLYTKFRGDMQQVSANGMEATADEGLCRAQCLFSAHQMLH